MRRDVCRTAALQDPFHAIHINTASRNKDPEIATWRLRYCQCRSVKQSTTLVNDINAKFDTLTQIRRQATSCMHCLERQYKLQLAHRLDNRGESGSAFQSRFHDLQGSSENHWQIILQSR